MSDSSTPLYSATIVSSYTMGFHYFFDFPYVTDHWVDPYYEVHNSFAGKFVVNPPHFSSIDEAILYLSSFSFTFDEACLYCLGNNLDRVLMVEICPQSSSYYNRSIFHTVRLVFFPPEPPCCYPDFSSIVKTLGGSPSSVQLDNLKSICQLLGVDTSNNGLKDCDLMKDYLKRLVSFFGGSPSSEPNDNLKSICQLLDIDTADNGLKDCELSKYYVKQISNMLGGTNA